VQYDHLPIASCNVECARDPPKCTLKHFLKCDGLAIRLDNERELDGRLMQGLVRCTPYVRIAKVSRQQLGDVMEILTVQVAGQLLGKGFDLLEFVFR
jgi:hypothetical protein